jgi:hypothetical protein
MGWGIWDSSWMAFAKEKNYGRVSWGLMIFLGVFSILFLGGALMLTKMGPGRMGGGKAPRNVEMEEKRADLVERIASTPMWTVEELDSEKVEQLNQIAKEWESISQQSSRRSIKGYDRIENLLSLWGKRESLQLEEDARELIQSGGENFDRGVKMLEEAANRQQKVNARFPNASGQDLKRVMSIESEIKSLLAAPILARVDELEAQGRQALDAGDADVALVRFREAELRFRELHVKYPSFSKAHVGRLSALGKLAAKAESWEEIQRLKQLISNAETVVGAGQFLSGAKMYQLAQKGLIKLGEQPGGEVDIMQETVEKGLKAAVLKHYSQVFSSAWQDVNHSLRQTGISVEAIWQKLKKIQEIQAEIDEMFPRFSANFSGEQERLEFLQKRKSGLVAQIQSLREEFLTVPGKPDWKMMRCEVWQELYTGLMEVPNPSRNQGDQLPVESVTIKEAEAFAGKVSWLLGMEVVLPTRELFFAAAGNPLSADQIPIVPLGRMVPVKSGKTLSGGFYHLWGNVSEWISGNRGSRDLAEHTGGHFLDTGETVFAELVRKSTIRDRSRSVGFRLAYRQP